MLKKFLIFTLLTLFIFADGPLLKTGQTLSYDPDGNVVTDGSIKDDGYYQIGASRSYSRSEAGVVTDHITGLEWQDINLITNTWGNARDYCTELSLDGDKWHLPSIEELETIVHLEELNPAQDKFVFQSFDASRGLFFSSTFPPYDPFSSLVFVIDFFDGAITWTSGGYDATKRWSRCARGELEPSSFRHNESTVIDDLSGLQWQDDEDVAIVW